MIIGCTVGIEALGSPYVYVNDVPWGFNVQLFESIPYAHN